MYLVKQTNLLRTLEYPKVLSTRQSYCMTARGVLPVLPAFLNLDQGGPPDLDLDFDLGGPRTLTWTLTGPPPDLDLDLYLGKGPLDLDQGAPRTLT